MGVAASWNDNCQGVEESNKIKKNICKKKTISKNGFEPMTTRFSV